MTNKIFHKFLRLVFLISSFLLPCIKVTTSTSVSHQLVSTGAHYKCIQKERDALLDFKAHIQDLNGRLSKWTEKEEDFECCKWNGVTCNNRTGHVTRIDLSNFDYAEKELGGKISSSLLNLSFLSYLNVSWNSFNGTIPMFIGSMSHLSHLDLSANSFSGTFPSSIGSLTRLIDLDLSYNSLSGTIPSSIGSLTNLIDLDLSYNSLSGIPSSIGSLTNLTNLDLHVNSLSGIIPSSIGSLTRLTYLDLSHNSLSGTIPSSIGSLTRLIDLDLSYNSLSGSIPSSIGSLTRLTDLDLSANSLSGTIPSSIGSLANLIGLDLSNNFVNGTIPAPIGSLTKLIYLGLSNNYLLNGIIPPELGNLTNLQCLSLNNLTSCFCENIDWLSNMSNLNELSMDGISLAKANKWVNVILSLQKLSSLSLSGCDLSQVMHPYSSSLLNSSSSSIDTLDLSDNNLNSSIYHWLVPLTSNNHLSLYLSRNMLDLKSFVNLCNLINLDFSYNSAVGKLPDFLNNWSRCTSVSLQYLRAAHNQFTGSLTGSLTNVIQMFSSLEVLSLPHNEINGPISEKVWELPKLQTINLSNNSIEGIISETHMSNLSSVTYIDLSSNNLGSRFPKWIQNFKNLVWLNIAKNRISDTIPREFWNMWPSQLQYLNLSTNNINGEVPDLVSNFQQPLSPIIDLSSNNFCGHIPKVPSTLASLDLSKNKFHGGISFLCQISDGALRYLDLSHNSFIGRLPDCLWHFEQLKVLNLGSNNLLGRLPTSVGSMTRLEVLSLYNNDLFGDLPLSLKSCTMLTFLDLGANMFTGNVPPWIGESLPELYVLSLTSNKLLGHIPLQLCQLANLQILDLSMNNLYGSIPSCLNKLTAMVKEGVFYARNMHGVSTPGPLHRRLFSTQPVRYSPWYEPSEVTYIDHAMIHWQGNTQEFSKNLGFLKGIDLSRNNLTGQIPYELTDLHGLIALNLSNNALDGKIPWKISEMIDLLALDLSRNNLSGEIPQNMSNMSSLDYLDVSYNNLSGRIPSSTQLQSFEPSRYIGNAGLCGPPLTKYCPGDKGSEVPHVEVESEDDGKGADGLQKWLYTGGAVGFPTGFWVVCGTLLLNRRARHAFFH